MSVPRILLVQDSASRLEALKLDLEEHGFELELVTDAPAALRQLAGEARFDLVLVDVPAPGLGGYDLCRSIKADVRLRSIPVLLLAAPLNADREQILGLLLASFEDVVQKDRQLSQSRAELEATKARLDSCVRELKRRAAETELRHRTLLHHASDAILVVDDCGVVTEANEAAERLFGRGGVQLLGTRADELVDGLALPEEGSMEVREVEIQRPGAPARYADLSIDVISVGGHKVCMLVFHDATEARRLRAQLFVADRMVSVGTLAAGVAHEINNPLAAILANLELGKVELDALADARVQGGSRLARVIEMLEVAQEAGDRVRSIVQDVRVFSRPDDESVEPLDVTTALESSLRLARGEIRHRARLVKEYGEVPAVMASAARLGQVFLNLIVNAAQAIPEGASDDNEIRVRTRASDGRAVIEISDTGVGMAPEVQRQLFRPFFTTKAPGVGTGLGLSICRRIVSDLGGTISAESAEGHGSTFRIILPAAIEQPSRPEREPFADGAPAPRRGRVLVVDDEPMVAEAVQSTLASEHEVEVVTSGARALDKIAAGARYDAIVCDLLMGEVTGMDFFERVRASSPEHSRKVVFLTGGAFTPRARAFIEQCNCPHLEKPFEPGHLRAVVATLMRGEPSRGGGSTSGGLPD